MGATGPIDFVVFSDYLCPWCANAVHRWRTLEREFGDRIRVDWRAYLLRPEARPPPADADERERRREKFFRYAKSWQRPASEPDAYPFREWTGDHDPPTHSVPAQIVARAAKQADPERFAALHDRLFEVYFREGRDVSSPELLRSLWVEAGFDAAAFGAIDVDAVGREVFEDHFEARRRGVTGVPTVQLVGNDALVVGAQPVDLLRRWIERIEREPALRGL